MKPDHRDTLLLAFDRGLCAPPEGSARWVFLNAEPLPPESIELRRHLDCEQGFRPIFLALEKAGYSSSPVLEDGVREGAIVFAGRVRQVNQANIARAWNMTKPGGNIIVCGSKTSGIQSLRRHVEDQGIACESLSKHHAQVFHLVRGEGPWPVEAAEAPAGHSEFLAAPGMFSADGPDKGSQLLAKHFSDRIRGRIADLGAGWGYLSYRVLQASSRIEAVNLFEADWLALEAAKANLSRSGSSVPCGFHWCDVTSEFPKSPYDWVIMNPPFHTGRAATPELGRKFIAVAASTLVQGGRLLMVANRSLPYEKSLEGLFRRMAVLDDRDGFKVIEAVR